jgi:hypothetical protein
VAAPSTSATCWSELRSRGKVVGQAPLGATAYRGPEAVLPAVRCGLHRPVRCSRRTMNQEIDQRRGRLRSAISGRSRETASERYA